MSYNQTPSLSKHVAKKIAKQLNKKNGMKTLQHLMLLYSKSHKRKMTKRTLAASFRQTDDFYHLHPTHMQYKQLETRLRSLNVKKRVTRRNPI